MAYIDIPNKVLEKQISEEVEKQLENGGILSYVRRLVHMAIQGKIKGHKNEHIKITKNINSLRNKVEMLQKREVKDGSNRSVRGAQRAPK